MRPIDKGSIPKVNGIPKTVNSHRDWRSDLIGRIGYYCCYCNIPLKDSPQVEHVVAQDIDPNRALDWNNVILACGPCNRTKTNKPCPPSTHYLPEYHNTHLAFEYFISPNLINGQHAAFVRESINPLVNRVKAAYTIALCALDRDTTRVFQQATDLRYKFRYEAILKTVIWRNEFDTWGKHNLIGFIKLLRTIVQDSGFWSIWYHRFCDIQEIRQMLVEDIDGTDTNSFDPMNYLPLPRTPLQAGDSI
jgi:hypothetical protein